MEDNCRKTELYLSCLILFLYGDKDYRLIKDNHYLTDVKKCFLKIIKSIKFAIQETITITDDLHKQDLLSTINKYEGLVKSSKSFDNLDQRMISFQSELIFLLIGLMPHRSTQRVINNRSAWKLDDYRQIQYTQNTNQKRNVIFGAVQGKYREEFGSWNEFLSNIYCGQCHNNPDELILWLKSKHPEIYSDLF